MRYGIQLSTEEWDKIIQDELKMLEAVQED